MRGDSKLPSLRLITRYYQGEEPYVSYFIKYHIALGIKDFLIIVQSQMDFEVISLITSSFSDCCISVYLSCVDGSVSSIRVNWLMTSSRKHHVDDRKAFISRSKK